MPKSLIKGLDLKLIDTTLAELANGDLVEFNIYKIKLIWDNKIKEAAVFDTNSEEALIGTSFLSDKLLMVNFANRQITISEVKNKN